jgi:hypothetical protein
MHLPVYVDGGRRAVGYRMTVSWELRGGAHLEKEEEDDMLGDRGES